jgi:3-deoxy-D-manno-octulosonic acid (KDO) 8-phosphate synthase
MVCERGFSFGYNNLVHDMRSLAVMRETGCPVVFDAHAFRAAAGRQGHAVRGQREFVPVLARAAVAAGRLGHVHGNASRSRQGAVGRAERVALDACARCSTLLRRSIAP